MTPDTTSAQNVRSMLAQSTHAARCGCIAMWPWDGARALPVHVCQGHGPHSRLTDGQIPRTGLS